jgi:hypothetical protein
MGPVAATMAAQVIFFSVPFLRKARRKNEGDCSSTYTTHTSLGIETEFRNRNLQIDCSCSYMVQHAA